MWAVKHGTCARETVEGLVSAECMCCYAMMSTVIKSVRASWGDSRLIMFRYVIGFGVVVDVRL